MELENTKVQLRAYIRERFKVPENDPDFNDEIHLFDYGYVDSFGAVELIHFVEKTFSVKISQNDLIAYPLNTVSEISSFVIKRQKGEI
jgi:D-alanine--poly(phosphoribitol) ligase subunit 2